MNYQQLVLSKNPGGYVNYNSGSATDLVGVFTTSQTTVDLNPLYDRTFKKHGTRSKKIGHNGAGTYDRINYVTSGHNYWHVESWVYLSTATMTDVVELFPFWVNGNNPSYARIQTNRTIRWYTQSATDGTGDNNLYSTAVIPVGQWTHVAVQYLNGLKKIYINGVLNVQVSAIAHTLIRPSDCSYTGETCWVDEYAFWAGTTAAIIPTDAEILERVNFPNTKTKWWDATTSQWLTSGDEQYWNGTQWISMQDMPYKYWNGTDWVTL